MKAVCVLHSVSRANGGIFEAEKRLQNELATNPGLQVEVQHARQLARVCQRPRP